MQAIGLLATARHNGTENLGVKYHRYNYAARSSVSDYRLTFGVYPGDRMVAGNCYFGGMVTCRSSQGRLAHQGLDGSLVVINADIGRLQ